MAQKVNAVLEQLLESCLKPGTVDVIKASQIHEFKDQPFSVYCEKFADPKYKDPLSNHQKLIMKNGIEHEAQYMTKYFPGVTKLQITNRKDGLEECLKQMINGEEVIWGGTLCFVPHGMDGRADILQRVNGKSIFGDYQYVVKEIKSHQDITKSDILQCAFYNHILGIIQETIPDTFYLINSENDKSPHEFDKHKIDLISTIDELRKVLNGTQKIFPTFRGVKYGQWITYCDEQAIKNQDISIVDKVGPDKREKLIAKNFTTIKQLASCDPGDLIMKGIREPTENNIISHAKALTQKKPIRKSSEKIIFSQATTEIFLDLEGAGSIPQGTSLISMDYLIGVLIRKNGNVKYLSFIAHDIHQEEEMLLKFLDFIKNQKDYVIYHYHHYEKSRLKKMMKRYSIDDNTTELILSDNVRKDLHKIATSTWAFPTNGYSLKEIAKSKLIGFNWRHKDVDALESIAMYLDYVKDPNLNKNNIQLIQEYNEDDCRATLRIKDWLTKNN